MQLNESQLTAIRHNKGAMMVLAGPGSGKTTVITRRTMELIESWSVPPEKILVITFTRAAATEMKDRFERLYGRPAAVSFGTFHAVFFKIIKYAYSYDASCILTEEERYRVLREAVYELGIDIQDEKDFLESISTEISAVKSGEIRIDNYYSTSCGADDFRKIFARYSRYLENERKIDFDDMMLICYELLKEREDILHFWQERYEYVLIDEFQDINLLQYKIIRLLAAPHDNIFIVGDDDQSIYSFRGANPRIMLGFEKDYPGCKRVVLDINYRSGQKIINLSQKLIGHNKTRFAKKVEGTGSSDGAVRVGEFYDVNAQNEFIAESILERKKAGKPLKDIAVLYRINAQPRALVEKLREYDIAVRINDRLPNIYEHWITSNILAYMELAAGNRERRLFMQIANRPKRYIPRESFTHEKVSFDDLCEANRSRPYVQEKLVRLRYDLNVLKKLSPYAAIKYIRNAIGYDDYLKEYAEYRHLNPDELFETLNELQEGTREFKTLDEWKAYMDDYRKLLKDSETGGKTAKEDRDRDAVSFMTFHSAKGLEFDTVYIIDVNESFTPYVKAEVAEDIEEERRMFYVAMTRAKNELYILSEKERFGKKLKPSRFISEL